MSASGIAVISPPGHTAVQPVPKALLACGIAASLLYVAMNIIVPLQWPGYSFASRVISELSAIGAPTRSLWVPLGIVYGALMVAFGWGVWRAAPGNRPLRIAAAGLGPRFRFYSIATLALLLAFGALTAQDAPRLSTNLPTPFIGVWERIQIGVVIAWDVVLAIAVLRRRPAAARSAP